MNELQIKYGAMYLATSNTGLIGTLVQAPKDKSDIIINYNTVSNEYLYETGEGLEQELEYWDKELRSGSEHFMKVLKEEVTFIFNEEG